MKVKTVTLNKNFKIGLPNYSNMDIGVIMTWEVGEGEEFKFGEGWDIINKELGMQANDLDQTWMKVDELKNKYKATVNIPKNDRGTSAGTAKSTYDTTGQTKIG